MIFYAFLLKEICNEKYIKNDNDFFNAFINVLLKT